MTSSFGGAGPRLTDIAVALVKHLLHRGVITPSVAAVEAFESVEMPHITVRTVGGMSLVAVVTTTSAAATAATTRHGGGGSGVGGATITTVLLPLALLNSSSRLPT